MKSKRWVQAANQSYEGDDWGGEGDYYSDEDTEDTSAPPPVPTMPPVPLLPTEYQTNSPLQLGTSAAAAAAEARKQAELEAQKQAEAAVEEAKNVVAHAYAPAIHDQQQPEQEQKADSDSLRYAKSTGSTKSNRFVEEGVVKYSLGEPSIPESGSEASLVCAPSEDAERQLAQELRRESQREAVRETNRTRRQSIWEDESANLDQLRGDKQAERVMSGEFDSRAPGPSIGETKDEHVELEGGQRTDAASHLSHPSIDHSRDESFHNDDIYGYYGDDETHGSYGKEADEEEPEEYEVARARAEESDHDVVNRSLANDLQNTTIAVPPAPPTGGRWKPLVPVEPIAAIPPDQTSIDRPTSIRRESEDTRPSSPETAITRSSDDHSIDEDIRIATASPVRHINPEESLSVVDYSEPVAPLSPQSSNATNKRRSVDDHLASTASATLRQQEDEARSESARSQDELTREIMDSLKNDNEGKSIADISALGAISIPVVEISEDEEPPDPELMALYQTSTKFISSTSPPQYDHVEPLSTTKSRSPRESVDENEKSKNGQGGHLEAERRESKGEHEDKAIERSYYEDEEDRDLEQTEDDQISVMSARSSDLDEEDETSASGSVSRSASQSTSAVGSRGASTNTVDRRTSQTSIMAKVNRPPAFNFLAVLKLPQSTDRRAAFDAAQKKEQEYTSGIDAWLQAVSETHGSSGLHTTGLPPRPTENEAKVAAASQRTVSTNIIRPAKQMMSSSPYIAHGAKEAIGKVGEKSSKKAKGLLAKGKKLLNG